MPRIKPVVRTTGTASLFYDCAGSVSLIAGARFVAISGNNPNPCQINYSADGITWSTAPLPADMQGGGTMGSVMHDGTYWFVGGIDSSARAAIWRTSDLSTWTRVWYDSASNYCFYCDNNGSAYYACGVLTNIGYSPTGASGTWLTYTAPGSSNISGIAVAPGGRVVIAQVDGLWYSDTNGASWTACTLPSNSGTSFAAPKHNGSYFIVRGFDADYRRFSTNGRSAVAIYTSADGVTWTREAGAIDVAPARNPLAYRLQWDTNRSQWIIGFGDYRVYTASGSQGSLSFAELVGPAGFSGMARVTEGSEGDYVSGIGVGGSAGNTLVLCGYDGKLTSGDWESPTIATNPSPAHEELAQIRPTTVSNTTSLSWSGGTGEVFFGKNPESLVSQGSQSSPWSPGTLDDNETYYWRVDIAAVEGDLWRFFTEPADTSEKLHTYGGTYRAWAGSGLDVTTITSWSDIITFSAGTLAGGHRYLVSMGAMTGQGSNGGFYMQFLSVDANGIEHAYSSAGYLRVAPYSSKWQQQKLQTILIPNPGENIKLRIKDWTGSLGYLEGVWVTLVDLDSPGMVEGVDWGLGHWSGSLETNNSSANDAFPVIDLEWTPDGESDYVVWAGARWNNGVESLDPHGYRLRDLDTGQLLALNGHLHYGTSSIYDGNASVHAFRKPANALKRLRMDVWGYDYNSSGGSWRLTDANAVWFRISKMRNYAIDNSWEKRSQYNRNNSDIIPYYTEGYPPVSSVPFRPDADGTAVFFCYVQSMKDTRIVQTTALAAIMTWGDFGLHSNLWSTTRNTPARGMSLGTVDIHDNEKSWAGANRQRDNVLGCRRRTGLSNEVKDIHVWAANLAGSNTTTYVTHHNVVAFGEQFCDAGGKPGIQQLVPFHHKRAVPHDEPITFKVASENGVNIEKVQIKERWSPQEPVPMGGDAVVEGAYFYRIASNGSGVLVASSNTGKVYRSIDGGNNWSGITLPLVNASANKACEELLWNPVLGKFVGVSDDAIIFSSSDGLTWSEVDTGGTNRIRGLAQNSSGRMVASDYNGSIWYSDDAASWTEVSGLAGTMYDVECDGTTFVAVGSGAVIVTSTDGSTWTPRTNPGIGALYDVAYGNGVWVVANLYYNHVLTATDPTGTWTLRELGHEAWPYRIAFGNGEFIMQSWSINETLQRPWFYDGRLFASTDGISWERVGYICDNEKKNGWWGTQANTLFWNATWLNSTWWICNARPAGSMLKFAGKFLGSSWEDVILNNVFQSGWSGSITATPGISGMVDVTINPGSNLKYWTNYLVRVEASDAVTTTDMEPYEWDFNTWANRLQVFNVHHGRGFSCAPYSTQYDEVTNACYITSSSNYSYPRFRLPTELFTNGHRYLVLGTAQCSHGGYDPMWYLHRDGVYDADVNVRSRYVYNAAGTHNEFMRLYNDIKERETFEWYMRASGAGISSSAYFRNTYLTAIDLDSGNMVENTNWWYAEDDTYTADVSTWTTFANVTFDAIAGEKYLVMACCNMDGPSNYPNSAFRIYDETAAAEIARGGFSSAADTNAQYCNMQVAVVTPVATGSHKVRVDMHGGSYFDHRFSSIFVLHLGAFKKHAETDLTLNQTGLSNYVYPHASGDPTPKASVTVGADLFGEVIGICAVQGDTASTTSGLSANMMVNGFRFADTQLDDLGTGPLNYTACIGGYTGSNSRPSGVICNAMHFSSADNDLDLYVGALNGSDLLERVAIVTFGTEPAEPPAIPVDLSLDPINTASSLGDIDPDVSTPIPEPDIPDYPREVYESPSAVGVKLSLLEPTAQTTDQLQIADRSQFVLVTTPTLDDLGVPPGDTGGTVRLGLLPGDRIVLSGTGPNDGVTYTIKDGNTLTVLEEINDWSTDSATYDFVAYRRK